MFSVYFQQVPQAAAWSLRGLINIIKIKFWRLKWRTRES